MKILYYMIINLIYYRKERDIDTKYLTKIRSVCSDTREEVTNAMLSRVGLRISYSDTIPWYIPLSKAQKGWIKTVSEFGYKVTLI